MAKFCTKCGRRLEEGEVCNCQGQAQGAGQAQNTAQAQPQYQYQYQGQQAAKVQIDTEQMKQMGAQAVAGAQNMFLRIVPVLKRPVTETRKIASEHSPLVGLEFMGLKALVVLIIVLVAAARLSDAMGGLIEMPYFKLILLALLLTLAMDVLEAFLLKSFAGMFGGSTDINAMFSVVGSRALYDGIIAAAAGILALIFPKGMVFVVLIGGVILPYVEYGAFRAVVPGDEDRRVYAFFLVKAIVTVVMYLIFYALGQSVLSVLTGSLMSSFGSLM
ncbi:hypothetical protein [Mordavella massiliensis]|uniref:Uncharacterized protein n=1 Tax=Mordavella massiliensis TaxID=1871024 RepID=A0A938XAL3_9CLOT|nr:hypothetical protein [Mordavella massiliensis]MBM6947345.1 hypothetical protein [Mordavella massiliensis]